ncbi:hypothetical protein LAUMK136_05656 [Mycobacterium attenuatum]|uniref:Uncharacterized protein n=1 Tax=Mycobacterium attenuatum TaxID=2341086 RepID=A0A498QJ01_9MYCO|nr:hypothetical protein [Mycobacterium attenuatum]VBA44495.1 hypothetical protein LAUMK136_05656 [Mycobacterium attenuatum]
MAKKNCSEEFPSLSTLSETLRPEIFTEPEGEYGENEVEQQRQQRQQRCRRPASAIVDCGGGSAGSIGAERAQRRTFTANYKLAILEEYERAERAERGALLRSGEPVFVTVD